MSLRRSLVERRAYLIVGAVVLLLDQLSKLVVHAQLSGRGPVTVIPSFFNLDYSRNPGALFGTLRDLPDPWRMILLTLLPLVAVVLIAVFLLRGTDLDRGTLCGLGLILGGATGNLIDRIFRGEVIDFLDVYVTASGFARWLEARFGTAHWPTFNVADSAIVVGAGLLALGVFRGEPSAAPSAEPDPADSGRRG
ncbi:MAG: signal peptidase II [bacterium]|nr:signal peptidase II [bacterium]